MLDRVFLNGGSGGGGWIGLLGGASEDGGKSVKFDSAGNIYVTGYTSQGGKYGFLTAKYSNAGVIQWQRKLEATLSFSGNNVFGNGIAVDGAGNVYVCGTGPAQMNEPSRMILAKYDNSGTFQWTKSIRSFGPAGGNAIALDSSGSVYVCGNSSPSSDRSDILVSKYNASGTNIANLQFGKSGTTNDYGNGIAIGSDNTVYICGNDNNNLNPPRNKAFLSKLDTAFSTYDWQRSFELISTSYDYMNGIAVNSSGDIYAVGSIGIGNSVFLICKFNNSGNIQWQRWLGNSDSGGAYGIALDNATSDIYVTGAARVSGTYAIVIAKYNSSGVLQWQRSLNGAGTDSGDGIALDSSGNIYITGYVGNGSTNELIIAKLPSDGSGLGTYSIGGVSFTYAISSLTDQASTASVSSVTNGSGSSLTHETPAMTNLSSTLTSTVVNI